MFRYGGTASALKQFELNGRSLGDIAICALCSLGAVQAEPQLLLPGPWELRLGSLLQIEMDPRHSDSVRQSNRRGRLETPNGQKKSGVASGGYINHCLVEIEIAIQQGQRA